MTHLKTGPILFTIGFQYKHLLVVLGLCLPRTGLLLHCVAHRFVLPTNSKVLLVLWDDWEFQYTWIMSRVAASVPGGDEVIYDSCKEVSQDKLIIRSQA